MRSILQEVLEANRRYSESFGSKASLPAKPLRRLAILTCMDARMNPAEFAGLSLGDAHVIRNAGGRASDDAIRSLVVSYKLLGTCEFMVIHHTNCGMAAITDEEIRSLLVSSVEPVDGEHPVESIDWLTIRDQEQSLVEDVMCIRNHPLVPPSIPIYGYIYDTQSGKLTEVEAATQAGAAR